MRDWQLVALHEHSPVLQVRFVKWLLVIGITFCGRALHWSAFVGFLGGLSIRCKLG
jgi:hypothetical protein